MERVCLFFLCLDPVATPVSGMSYKRPFIEGCTVSTNLHCRCSQRGRMLKAFKFTAVVSIQDSEDIPLWKLPARIGATH